MSEKTTTPAPQQQLDDQVKVTFTCNYHDGKRLYRVGEVATVPPSVAARLRKIKAVK